MMMMMNKALDEIPILELRSVWDETTVNEFYIDQGKVREIRKVWEKSGKFWFICGVLL